MFGDSRRFHRGAWFLALVGVALVPVTGQGAQIDAATFFLLKRGMSESEVLVRAGPPDLVTSPGSDEDETRSGAVVEVAPGVFGFDAERHSKTRTIKELHYIPGPEEHDPHLTVITVKGGRVWDIIRTKLFHRPPARQEALPEPRPRSPSDEDIKVQQAEDTLRAAERYAATRARLKEQARASRAVGNGVEGADGSEERPVYQLRKADGTVYYGDRMPDDDSPGPRLADD